MVFQIAFLFHRLRFFLSSVLKAVTKSDPALAHGSRSVESMPSVTCTHFRHLRMVCWGPSGLRVGRRVSPYSRRDFLGEYIARLVALYVGTCFWC